MKRIISQCIKELSQIKRNRLTLAFLLPFMTLLIFGFATRLESQNIPLIIQDYDHTNLSNSYIENYMLLINLSLKNGQEKTQQEMLLIKVLPR
ncbi:MAG: hypothetical protein AN488_15455 [Anabaena sp. WA113]|jgi:hypothetical protein|uniref:ABC transporter permease n=1 Tax=Aphanizomenon flos-aquae WA102 TaxID=1710896 RepID=A0A1B7WZS2_APHFL|nr:MAG: hypothetical protein AN488_15455 [Anabaena sp. WA113]OBQ42615.1 MAG: hypothetical protein AN484_16705 [Aphanizomenon flos-aquae WA102]